MTSVKYSLHPRPNPIAAALFTLRDLDADAMVLHGPSGCNFRALRLLEIDGVKVFTTSLSDYDVIMGGSSKLLQVLKILEEQFDFQLVGVVGTCCSSIIGEDVEQIIEHSNYPFKVLAVNVPAYQSGNVIGVLRVVEKAAQMGLISYEELERQKRIMREALQLERLRGIGAPGYLPTAEGHSPQTAAKAIIKVLKKGERVAVILNTKKELTYLYADILIAVNEAAEKLSRQDLVVNIANIDCEWGLPKVRRDASIISRELAERGIIIHHVTGCLDDYPASGRRAAELLMNEYHDISLAVVVGIPHAVPIEQRFKAVGIANGNRTIARLLSLGFFQAVNEPEVHMKVLGKKAIIPSQVGNALRRLLRSAG